MKIQYLTTCNSQYFQGSSKPTVQVLVDGNTTWADVKDALLDNQTTSHLDYTFTERQWDEYNAAVEEWFNNYVEDNVNILLVKWESSLEIPGEDDEYDCYSYFIIEIDEEA